MRLLPQRPLHSEGWTPQGCPGWATADGVSITQKVRFPSRQTCNPTPKTIKIHIPPTIRETRLNMSTFTKKPSKIRFEGVKNLIS